jgi:hypothetical protein
VTIRQRAKMKTSRKDMAEFTTSNLVALMTTWADHKERVQQIETLLLSLAGAYGLPSVLSDRRCIVKFTYPELNAGRKSWWIVKEGDEVDLCSVDPGHDVNLYVSASVHAMTAVWMGVSTLKTEIEARNITLTGDKAVARSMQAWLGLSPFAAEKNRVAS